MCAPSVAQQFLQHAQRLSLLNTANLHTSLAAGHMQVWQLYRALCACLILQFCKHADDCTGLAQRSFAASVVCREQHVFCLAFDMYWNREACSQARALLCQLSFLHCLQLQLQVWLCTCACALNVLLIRKSFCAVGGMLREDGLSNTPKCCFTLAECSTISSCLPSGLTWV